MALPVAATVSAPPAVAQPRPGTPPVVGGKGPTPPPPPVQTQDEEAALAAMMQDGAGAQEIVAAEACRPAEGLVEGDDLAVRRGGRHRAIALVWLASNAMSRQKHGWDTYIQEPTAASPGKKKAGAERVDKTVRDSGKKRDEGKFAVRPRPGVAQPPRGAGRGAAARSAPARRRGRGRGDRLAGGQEFPPGHS